MNLLRCFLLAGAFALGVSPAFAAARDPLAQRDDWGLLHQSAEVSEVDYEPREFCRFFYYSKTRHMVAAAPAYVGALQVALQRNGYYCGPIDGAFTEEVKDAIARLQKAHRMRVNGALTVPVRRALHLP